MQHHLAAGNGNSLAGFVILLHDVVDCPYQVLAGAYYDWKEKLGNGYFEKKFIRQRKRKIDREKLKQTSLSQNSVSFVPSSLEKRLTAVFSIKSKVACNLRLLPKTEVLGQPQTVKEKPDAYLSELARQFGCTPQTVFYMLLKLKITVKKTFTYAEKSEEQRALFAAKLKMFPAGKRVLPLLVTGIRQTAFFLKTGL